jgi:iron(III) transport system ATP-binding protein
MAQSPIAIEVSSVTKRFGSVVALDNVSFSVEAGEMFFLLGPSGCGKTTLLRILAGLETPDSGTIRFDGKDIMGLPPHQRGAPMVFQNYALWPHLNVKDNIAFGLVERRISKSEIDSRVAEVLRLVELGGLENRMPGQLSGGQQQRVVLARALVLNPKIILLDEPLSNLDAKLRVEMRDEIGRLHTRTDITFVYVTHDQAEALSLADRMAVLSAGKVSAIGPPRELYHRPPNLFCADFLGEANMIPGRVAAVDRGVVTVKTALGEWKAHSAREQTLLADTAVTCLVRPENLVLINPSPHPSPARGEGDTRTFSSGLQRDAAKFTSSPSMGEDRGEGEDRPANHFEAEIKSMRMNGATVTVTLDANGVSIKATLLNRAGFDLKPGNKSIWAASVDDTVVME